MSRHLSDATIQDLFDDALHPDRRRKAEQHLATCPDCAIVFDELNGLRTLLRSLPRLAHPPSFALLEREAFQATERMTARGRRVTMTRVASLAAVFAAGLLLGTALDVRGGAGGPGSRRDQEAMHLATEVQRTGTAYAAAVVALGDLGDAPAAERARAQGREAALSVLYAATLAYAGLEPRDANIRAVVEAVDAVRRRASAIPSTEGT